MLDHVLTGPQHSRWSVLLHIWMADPGRVVMGRPERGFWVAGHFPSGGGTVSEWVRAEDA